MARIRALFGRLASRSRPVVPPEILTLAPMLEAAWPEQLHRLRASGVPIAAGEEGDGDGDGDGDGEEDGEQDGDGDEGDGKPAEPDWKRESRKHERRAKAEAKRREEAERKLAEAAAENQTEQEKALEQARKEAREEALSEAEKERRADRLEVATTRLAAKGVTVGEGDDAQTFKFADSEDALLRVERGIRRGDIDADDIYDDEGKVITSALTAALVEIAEANPHLVLNGDGKQRPSGDPGTRRGEPAQTDLERMTPEDHAKRKYPASK